MKDQAASGKPQPAPAPIGLDLLAEKLARSYEGYVQFFQEVYKLSREEAEERVKGLDPNAELRRAMSAPPDQVTWLDLSTVADSDSRAALNAWGRLHNAAEMELQSGHRAAAAISYGFDFGPYDRARFLAVRRGLVEEWQPLPGSETMLVDMLAQMQVLWEEWLHRHILQLRIGAAEASSLAKAERADVRGFVLPRLSEAEAFEESMAMMERVNRMAIRTIRALRDLKRFTPAVVVQNAGQVNVAEKQVNVSPP